MLHIYLLSNINLLKMYYENNAIKYILTDLWGFEQPQQEVSVHFVDRLIPIESNIHTYKLMLFYC